MRISEAIHTLRQIWDENGDLELISMTDVQDHWCLEVGRVFEVVKPEGFPNFVCSYMNEIGEEGDQGSDPPKLKLIK